ncbi:MAG: flavin reductase family protein, partial [Nitrospiria bacterium]
MDANMKKTALRMIPYGLYILAAGNNNGRITASTVNWVTQASFEPPLVVVGVKADSLIHQFIKEAGTFSLNVLGKGQKSLAFSFFKPVEKEGKMIGGEPFHTGREGSPILENTPAFIECILDDILEKGDHSIIVGKVVDVGISKHPDGRADEATLWLKDLGEKVFY